MLSVRLKERLSVCNTFCYQVKNLLFRFISDSFLICKFFHISSFRYPSLFDFIFNQLQLATDAISRNERPMNLHPLLLLLGRLYPSSLEGCESNLQLSVFLPFIVKCSVCPELETRRLAVKSIAALIPPNKLFEQQLSAFSLLHVRYKHL